MENKMKIAYAEVLQGFEYDEENAYWIRKEDGKAFHLLEKDENDIVRIAEACKDIGEYAIAL
jgi:hypothetical protein